MEKNKVINISFFAVGAALLIAVAFADLKISIALYNTKSIFGLIFKVAGDLPMHAFLPLFSSVMHWQVQKRFRFDKKKRIIAMAITLGILALSSFIFADRTLTYLPIEGGAYLALFFAIAAATFLAAFLAFKYVSTSTLNKWLYILTVAVIFALISLLLVHFMKAVWGRMRFRNLVAPDYADFSHWFMPNGVTGNTSFPSGHTASACGFMIAPLAAKVLGLKKSVKVAIYVISVAFIFATALSRVVLGAHFVSDTLASVLVCYGSLLLTKWIVARIMSKKRLTVISNY